MVQKDVQEVIMYKETPDGFDMEISSTTYDRKDKEIMTSNLRGSCENGVYTFDVRNFVNDQMMQAFEGMEVTVEGEPLEIPNNLRVGQDLPSGNCMISAASGDVNLMKLTLTVEDRKVTGQESITTDAGTFDCYVIEQTLISKLIMKQTYTSVQYIAGKYGPVRIETYNKRGKLVSTRDLTAVE